MAPKVENYDDVTAFLGDYGRFQLLLVLLLSVSAAPCGYMGVVVVFVSDTPLHGCKGSSASARNGTHGPVQEPDGCSPTGPAHRNGTETCVDGWWFSAERETIVSEWDLVCDSSWKVPFSTSVFFVGVLLGSFLSGQLSDRWGRKRVFFVTMLLQSVTALIQAASVNWLMFCILNCLRGLGQISNYIASLVLGSEMLSPSARVSFTLLGHSLGFGIGYLLLPLLAYFIRGWRMLLVACAVPGLVFIPTWWLIPESPRWLLQRGRVEEAERIVRRAATMNRVQAPAVIFRAGEDSGLMQNKTKKDNERSYTYLDLMRSRNMRNITILGLFIWMSNAMVFYGLSLNTSNLNGDIYVNCFISAATDIVAYVATWLLARRLPRPALLSSTLMFCGIMLLVIQLVPEDMTVTFQVLALVGKLGVSVGYCFIYVMFTELVPTVVRNTGLGIFSTAARVGAIICPYVIYIGNYSKILPYIVFGVISVMAALVSIFLPDTRNSKLPDFISEAKPIRCCWSPKEKRNNPDKLECV